MPNMDFIYSLCKNYTDRAQDIDENYNYVLTELYKYSYSYKPSMSLSTWLHICTKRACFANNKRLRNQASKQHGLSIEDTMEAWNDVRNSTTLEEEFTSLLDSLSDETYEALMSVPMLKLSPFLYKLQGYETNEIVEMEYNLGHIPTKSQEIVRNRIFTARNMMIEYLHNHGVTRQKVTR